MNFPVFDLHCDTALALLGNDMRSSGSLRSNSYHIDLERAKINSGYAQFFGCFTTPDMERWYHLPISEIFEREMVTILREVENNKDILSLAYNASDVKKNADKGIMSAILSIEGPCGFDCDVSLLEDLHRVGFRMSTLGWNESNALTGSHETGGGLTEQGRAYVKEAQRLGMIVDVSHISDEGFWDIMDITEKPIVASHSNSRSVFDVSRNLTDDMFRAICQCGGVAGFNQYPAFIGDNATLDTACDHILHFLEIDPDADHIALGGDLDGCENLPAGFDGVQSYPKFAQSLLHRGLDETMIRKIFWENALGVMETCCM